MGGRYYTRATKLAGLVDIAAGRGTDIGVLMLEAGLDPVVLRNPEMAIDYGGFCELLRRCAAAWDLPDIGLRMIRYQQIDFLGPVSLVTRMELGNCTLEHVADSLRMPPRSLQRRLQAEGLSFRDLLDEWRRARALSLVTNTRLPLSEVSEALGYSEQSVFTQAFRRWYGGTPYRFRTQRVAANA